MTIQLSFVDIVQVHQSGRCLMLYMSGSNCKKLACTSKLVHTVVQYMPYTPNTKEVWHMLVRARSQHSTVNLKFLRHVQCVNLSQYVACDDDIVNLTLNVSSIKKLIISTDTFHNSNRPMVAITAHTELTVLKLGWCGAISNESMIDLIQRLPKLTKLGLRGGFQLTNQIMHAFSVTNRIAPYDCLDRLTLRHCELLTDSALDVLATHCAKLRHLDIAGCRGLRRVKRWPRLLKSVNMTRCYAIRDPSVQSLAECCSDSLLDLNLSFCRLLTDAIAPLLTGYFRHLQRLGLHYCTDMSSSVIDSLNATHNRRITNN